MKLNSDYHYFAHTCNSGNVIWGTAKVNGSFVEWSAGKENHFSKQDKIEFNIWVNHVAITLQKLYRNSVTLAPVAKTT